MHCTMASSWTDLAAKEGYLSLGSESSTFLAPCPPPVELRYFGHLRVARNRNLAASGDDGTQGKEMVKARQATDDGGMKIR